MGRNTRSDDGVVMRAVTSLGEGRYVLRRYTFDRLRRDGKWEHLSREVYSRGDTAAVLPYCRSRGTVVLTRQFRLPPFLNREDYCISVEVLAGLIEPGELPAVAIAREAQEETGICLRSVQEVLVAYMHPASLTERTHLFTSEYERGDCQFEGGGCASEGEDIEAFEISFDAALAMVMKGEIRDAKTILLLLYAQTRHLMEMSPRNMGGFENRGETSCKP